MKKKNKLCKNIYIVTYWSFLKKTGLGGWGVPKQGHDNKSRYKGKHKNLQITMIQKNLREKKKLIVLYVKKNFMYKKKKKKKKKRIYTCEVSTTGSFLSSESVSA